MKPQILLVEDDDALRCLLAATLTRAGYAVVSAQNGREAMVSVARQTIDLVVTDLIMPEQEGIETIVKLRRKYPSLPIIAISGGGAGEPMEYLRLASAVGAQDILAKPFLPDDLLASVARLCPLRG